MVVDVSSVKQLGDTRSHTNQCPDSGHQKKAVPENSMATGTVPIVDVISLERIFELLQPSLGIEGFWECSSRSVS